MRRPLDEPVRITGDRASHAEYGVGPASDYGCDIGTPVRAPFSGRVSSYVTTAGGLGIVVEGNDATFYGQHLWVRLSPGWYEEGDRIALSGNSGALTTGPHLHCYVIVHATGERLSMEEYLARHAPASTGSRPFIPPTTPTTGDDMNIIRRPSNGSIIFADELGSEPVLAYKSDDIGVAEYLDALVKIAPSIPDLSDRQFDIAAAVVSRRVAAHTARIAATVAAQITTGVKVDTAALAASLAPLLSKASVNLTDSDLALIAKAVADEQAKRLAS